MKTFYEFLETYTNQNEDSGQVSKLEKLVRI